MPQRQAQQQQVYDGYGHRPAPELGTVNEPGFAQHADKYGRPPKYSDGMVPYLKPLNGPPQPPKPDKNSRERYARHKHELVAQSEKPSKFISPQWNRANSQQLQRTMDAELEKARKKAKEEGLKRREERSKLARTPPPPAQSSETRPRQDSRFAPNASAFEVKRKHLRVSKAGSLLGKPVYVSDEDEP